MELLDNNTPQVELDNIHVLILAGIPTNKAEIFEVGGYGDIADNDEDANTFCIVHFASVLYMIQEDMESDGNQLASGDIFAI